MSNEKKNNVKPAEDLESTMKALIAKGKKEGMLRDTELNATLSKLDLTPEKIDEIYDSFEALGIQIFTAELEQDDSIDLVDAVDDGLSVDHRQGTR